MTRFGEAWQTAEEALKLAREIKNRELESAVLTTIAGLHLSNGDLNKALQAAEEGRDIAQRIGAMLGGVVAPWMAGTILRLQGDYEGAMRQSTTIGAARLSNGEFSRVCARVAFGFTREHLRGNQPGLLPTCGRNARPYSQPAHRSGRAPAAGTAFADIGFTSLVQDRVDEAADAFQKGLSYPSMFRYLYQPQSKIGLSLVALKRSRLDEAAKAVGEAREYVEKREMKNLYPLVAFTVAQVQLASGDVESALEQFARAEATASGMNMRPMVWQARASAASVLAQMGRTEEADVKRTEARAVVEEMAGLFVDKEMRKAFVESAVQRMGELDAER